MPNAICALSQLEHSHYVDLDSCIPGAIQDLSLHPLETLALGLEEMTTKPLNNLVGYPSQGFAISFGYEEEIGVGYCILAVINASPR